MDPGQFSSYQAFIRPLLLEALANTELTFDELNYQLYDLNRQIFNQLNKYTTAFFKPIAQKQQLLNDGPQ